MCIPNSDSQKWLIKRHERLQMIFFKRAILFILTGCFFITQSEFNYYSCTYTFKNMSDTVFKTQQLTCGDKCDIRFFITTGK